MNKFIRVNMTNKEVSIGKVPEKYAALGGRALTSNFVNDEVKPTCHPLGKYNKLIIAPGLLSGTSAPNSGRLSVLSLIHISEPTRLLSISYAVFCLKKKTHPHYP